jgi:hypothetical protein
MLRIDEAAIQGREFYGLGWFLEGRVRPGHDAY